MAIALTPAQVAERLGVSPKTVRRAMRDDGELASIAYIVHRTRRIDAHDLEAWIAKRKQQARTA